MPRNYIQHPPLADRMAAKTDRTSSPDGCWPWTANRNRQGYGTIDVSGASRLAHRVAYTLAFGPIPSGLDICHRCDNPPCVRPDHLFAGSAKDNMADMRAKGRERRATGEASGKARLTWEMVEVIRRRYAPGRRGSLGSRALARELGISKSTVHRVVTGAGWRDENRPP